MQSWTWTSKPGSPSTEMTIVIVSPIFTRPLTLGANGPLPICIEKLENPVSRNLFVSARAAVSETRTQKVRKGDLNVHDGVGRISTESDHLLLQHVHVEVERHLSVQVPLPQAPDDPSSVPNLQLHQIFHALYLDGNFAVETGDYLLNPWLILKDEGILKVSLTAARESVVEL